MTKEQMQDDLEKAFIEFAAEYPQSALSTITGLFVGLLVHSVKEAGGDPTQQIKIDAQGGRDITVHAINAHDEEEQDYEHAD